MSASRAAGWLLAATLPAFSAEPALTHIFPVAGASGAKTEITASGKFEPWPIQVWVDAPGIVFKPGTKSGKFEVEVAPEAAPGPHLIRVFNDSGVSAPRYFIVAPKPDTVDAEPNDHFGSPQKIDALPATVSGRLSKAGDVDCFAIKLRKGQQLTASLEAYLLGSNFDGLLRVVDERGAVLTFNHDGRTLDPLLRWTAPGDGTFIVQLMGFVYPATASVSLTGSDLSIYRLHLTTAAENSEPVSEVEPNNKPDIAQPLETATSITGRIERAEDEDRFAFNAVKKGAYEVKMIAARAGSALDAWLKIEDASGKQLARSDDADGSRDPKLVWSAPADGRYFIALGDLTHRGGADFTYRLSLAEAKPTVTATSPKHSLIVNAGKTAELKFTVTRANGFVEPLTVVAKDLPEGITLTDLEVPKKDGEVTAKFTATAEAARANQPFQLMLRTASGAEYPVVHRMTTTGENNGVPNGFTDLVIPSTDQLWLTVIPSPAKPPAESKAPEKEPATATPAK